ncbi:hypothetical protein J4E91_004673 [Alternaria rosae]|nr:hypothetical protein J4E91_004673 [Alternaria rosae]
MPSAAEMIDRRYQQRNALIRRQDGTLKIVNWTPKSTEGSTSSQGTGTSTDQNAKEAEQRREQRICEKQKNQTDASQKYQAEKKKNEGKVLVTKSTAKFFSVAVAERANIKGKNQDT